MSLLTIARIAAVVVCAPLTLALVVNSDYRSDNVFVIPDLVGCALLLVGAAIYTSRSRSPWMFRVGFAWMSGVVLAAGFERLDDGTHAMAVANFTISAVFTVLAVLLARTNDTRSA